MSSFPNRTNRNRISSFQFDLFLNETKSSIKSTPWLILTRPLPVRACSIGTSRLVVWVGWVFLSSVGKNPCLVGLFDQRFQPALNLVEMVETRNG